MSLPVISQFVNIVLQKTICDLCLAPKVLQLDLVKILLGDDSLDGKEA